MTRPLTREDRPPKTGPRYQVVRITEPGVHVLTILSPKVWGVQTHWSGKGTIRCYRRSDEPPERCDNCVAQLPRRWKGYLFCVEPQVVRFGANSGQEVSREIFLELTPGAAEQIFEHEQYVPSLRGLRLKIERTRGGKNGRLNCQLYPQEVPEDLPPDRDPEETLRRLWKAFD